MCSLRCTSGLGFVPVEREASLRLPKSGLQTSEVWSERLRRVWAWARQLHQQRQQPGIAPGGQDHVRVVAAQVGPQADQQRGRLVQRQGVADALVRVPTAWVRDDDALGLVPRRVAVRFEREDAQRRGDRLDLPGRIQRRDADDLFAAHFHPHVCQREDVEGGGIAQRDGDIRVVPGQVREGRHHAAEERIQLDRLQHFDRQDRDQPRRLRAAIGYIGDLSRR